MRYFALFYCIFGTVFGLFAQSTTGLIVSGGLTRTYRLYVPTVYTGTKPVPLVLNLHGYGSNAVEQELYSNLRSVADTANFIIVHPEGTLDITGRRFWNSFSNGATVDDLGFLSRLIDSLQAKYNIDPRRMYSTGMSNGGFISYDLACQLSHRIAAIASVTGSMTQSNLTDCKPARPVPVMQIHGTADPTVPYAGGTLLRFTPVETLVDRWVARNQCNPTPLILPVPNIVTTDGCTAERYLYRNGIQGNTVEFFKIDGGGHTWPGASVSIGVTNQDFNASREIWRFFRQYTLNAPTSTAEVSAGDLLWSVSPNPFGDRLLLQTNASVDGPSRVSLFDVSGRLIRQTLLHSGTPSAEIDGLGDVGPGFYLLYIDNGQRREAHKVVK